MTDDQQTLPGMDRSEEGRRRRDEAIDRVRDHTPPGWMDAAVDCVRIALQQFVTITTDDVRRVAGIRQIPKPHDNRAWGAVMRRAIKSGLVVKTGEYVPTERPEAHRRPIPVYRKPEEKGEV